MTIVSKTLEEILSMDVVLWYLSRTLHSSLQYTVYPPPSSCFLTRLYVPCVSSSPCSWCVFIHPSVSCVSLPSSSCHVYTPLSTMYVLASIFLTCPHSLLCSTKAFPTSFWWVLTLPSAPCTAPPHFSWCALIHSSLPCFSLLPALYLNI